MDFTKPRAFALRLILLPCETVTCMLCLSIFVPSTERKPQTASAMIGWTSEDLRLDCTEILTDCELLLVMDMTHSPV